MTKATEINKDKCAIEGCEQSRERFLDRALTPYCDFHQCALPEMLGVWLAVCPECDTLTEKRDDRGGSHHCSDCNPTTGNTHITRTTLPPIPDQFTAEYLWSLLTFSPIRAVRHPWFPLLTLESPERYERVRDTWVARWVRTSVHLLSQADSRLFRIDCAERMLQQLGTDASDATDVASKLLVELRQLILKPTSLREKPLKKLTSAFRKVINKPVLRSPGFRPVMGLVTSVVEDRTQTESQIKDFFTSIDYAVHYAKPRPAESADVKALRWNREHVWQWERLLSYALPEKGKA